MKAIGYYIGGMPEGLTLGERIKAIRKAKGLTQVELAEEAGISMIHLSYIETGRRNPSCKTLKKLQTILQTKITI